MPELPEVETIVQGLKPEILNHKIIDIKINYSKILENMSPEKFRKNLLNKHFTNISRRAKYIIFHISDKKYLILHLRMTGKLLVKNNDDKASKHDHVVFLLDNGKQIFYNDTRKFGRFYLTNNPEEKLGKLGPEPLGSEFLFEKFSSKLSKSQRNIKALLLDQHFVAGLGNIYTDEALWEAKIHPQQSAYQISTIKRKALFQAIKNVIRKGIENRGTSLGDGKTNYVSSDNNSGKNQHELNVFARTGEPCPNCQSLIKKIVVSQRGTHFCPKCQKLK